MLPPLVAPIPGIFSIHDRLVIIRTCFAFNKKYDNGIIENHRARLRPAHTVKRHALINVLDISPMEYTLLPNNKSMKLVLVPKLVGNGGRTGCFNVHTRQPLFCP
jgi:hypothetical protein